jgi:hypothetical protein
MREQGAKTVPGFLSVIDMRTIATALGMAIALAAAGCGQSRTVPVKGQVFWDDGTPAGDLIGYMIDTAVPGSTVSSRADIGPEGKFVLGTFTPSDGAEPGTHKVVIASIPRADFEPPPKVRLPAKYANAATSGLTFTAERGKSNQIKLTVSRK